MARRRRPSIPLTILFIILLLLFLLSGTLVELVSNWAARGSFTFSYTSTIENDPVVSIVYTLPQDLAEALVPEQTEGWAVTLEDNILSLTGGTLNSGESVTVDYRFVKYIKGGTRNYTTTATTEDGLLIPKEKSFEMPDIFLLALVSMLYQNAIWLLVLAIIVLVVIIVLFVLGKKKDKEQEPKDFSGVNLQQGAVEVDSDLNEANDTSA
ncbi:MAG: hypothetical protein PVH73_03920 [Candidatus Bathyarchaeota archaeon]|jgi:hypothetical protein